MSIECYYHWCCNHEANLRSPLGDAAGPFCNNDYRIGCTATNEELIEFASLRREELRQQSLLNRIDAKLNDTDEWIKKVKEFGKEVDNLDKPVYTSTKQNEDRKMDEPTYSLNTYIRVYDDAEGSYIQIGPDRDGLNNIELIEFNDMNHEEGSILMPYGQFKKFMEACEIIYDSLDL